MSDPSKFVNLNAVWSEAGVKVEIHVLPPQSTKNNNKRKRKNKDKDGTSNSASGGKDVVDLEGSTQLRAKKTRDVAVDNVDGLGPALIHASTESIPSPDALASSLSLEPPKQQARADTSAPGAKLQKQKEIVQERMREKGMIPSIADLEACQRVGQHVLTLFNELAGELSKRLQDNRALKEEMEALKGVQGRLDAANAEVAKQRKALERVSVAEKERDEARKEASDAETREKPLTTRLEELTATHNDLFKQFAKASVDGFQMCLNLTAVLAPQINFAYFDGRHFA